MCQCSVSVYAMACEEHYCGVIFWENSQAKFIESYDIMDQVFLEIPKSSIMRHYFIIEWPCVSIRQLVAQQITPRFMSFFIVLSTFVC